MNEDKVKRLLLVNIPLGSCNFQCPYCLVTRQNAWDEPVEDAGMMNDIGIIEQAFKQSRFGGPCFINLCAKGETLIFPQVVPVLRVMLEAGHYVEVVTNGSLTKRFKEIAEFPPELMKRLEFKFSLHYTELKRKGIIDQFFDNVRLMREAGASFTIELMPVDEEEALIEEIKEVCLKNVGALCHATIARDDSDDSIPVLSKHSLDEYCEVWSTLGSEMLDFKRRIFQEERNEFCYAGDWSIYINLINGDLRKCYAAPVEGNFYDFSKPLNFEAIGRCPVSHCFNGHALMTFGLMPSVETPAYADIRNRVCADGSEWLSPELKSFFEGKLVDANEEYSLLRKGEINKKARHELTKRKILRILKKPYKCLSAETRSKIKRRLRRAN